jgi:hypothetical protein
MTNVNAKLPQDANNSPFNRAMGIPLCCRSKILGSGTYFRDMIDFPVGRVFNGMMVENPSTTLRIQIAIGDDFADDICIDLLPNGLVTFDAQTFGAFEDEAASIQMATKLRAKLSGNSGVLATANFAFSGQPLNSEYVVLNGVTYEFSSDMSVTVGRIKVDIGAALSNTMTNFAAAVNSSDPNIVAVAAAAQTDFTSIFGGTDGNAMAINAGTASTATASGATFSGGSGGVTPIIHIW